MSNLASHTDNRAASSQPGNKRPFTSNRRRRERVRIEFVNAGDLADLLAVHAPPCLSLYQPTHRHRPENQQDRIRFRGLVKNLEASLLQKYSIPEVQLLLEPFRALARNRDFWDHTLDGLAVLVAPKLFRVFGLQGPIAALAIAADSFHIKPLLRVLQTADRYQILGLTRQTVRLFEGNRDVLDEIKLAPGIPRTLTEALGTEVTEPHSTVASYGGLGTAMHHGHGSRKDETDMDAERFFRIIDRAILDHHSRPSGLPLLLAALPEHHARFHHVSHNPFLLAKGLEVNPNACSADELRGLAWQLIEPQYQAQLAQLIEEFGTALSKGLGSDDLTQVAQAATAGRIATLLIDAERQIPGRLEQQSGRVELGELAHPEIDDLLDDLGERVIKKGGRVVVVPRDQMPTQTGVAASYRF